MQKLKLNQLTEYGTEQLSKAKNQKKNKQTKKTNKKQKIFRKMNK